MSIYVSMRFTYVAAAVRIVFAFLFIAPAVLMGISSAHAETGISGFLGCIQSAGVPPRPSAEDWSQTIRTINFHLNSAESPPQVAQELAGMGVKPNDAVAEVQCVLANAPQG
jgi:hypothetical protein